MENIDNKFSWKSPKYKSLQKKYVFSFRSGNTLHTDNCICPLGN